MSRKSNVVTHTAPKGPRTSEILEDGCQVCGHTLKVYRMPYLYTMCVSCYKVTNCSGFNKFQLDKLEKAIKIITEGDLPELTVAGDFLVKLPEICEIFVALKKAKAGETLSVEDTSLLLKTGLLIGPENEVDL